MDLRTRSITILATVFFAASACCGMSQNWEEDDPNRVRNSIVYIVATAQDEWGVEKTAGATGFFINREGNILTTFHLLSKLGAFRSDTLELTVSIKSKSDERIDATIINADEGRDLLLLRVESRRGGNPACLTIDRAPSALLGKPVVTMGFPSTLPFVFGRGAVISIDGPGGTMVTEMPINEGQSGSPVLNDGRVVGIAKGQLTDTSGRAVAGQYVVISLNSVAGFLPRIGVNLGCLDEVLEEEPTEELPLGDEESLDIIIVVDDSGSMKRDQMKLANALASLLVRIDETEVVADYHVCITTTDAEYYRGEPITWVSFPGEIRLDSKVLTAETPNRANHIVETIANIGAEWSSDEQAIRAVSLLVRHHTKSNCIRQHGYLYIIVLSDEDERSTGGVESLSKVQYKPLNSDNLPEELLKTLERRLPEKTVVWNAIIVEPGDRVCEQRQDQQSSPSFPGVQYSYLAELTGGQTASICDLSFDKALSRFFNLDAPEFNHSTLITGWSRYGIWDNNSLRERLFVNMNGYPDPTVPPNSGDVVQATENVNLRVEPFGEFNVTPEVLQVIPIGQQFRVQQVLEYPDGSIWLELFGPISDDERVFWPPDEISWPSIEPVVILP